MNDFCLFSETIRSTEKCKNNFSVLEVFERKVFERIIFTRQEVLNNNEKVRLF